MQQTSSILFACNGRRLMNSTLASVVVVAMAIVLSSCATPPESLAQPKSAGLGQAALDQINAVRGVDLQNRLTMLRALRENRAPKADIAAFEISAVGLLQAMDLENVPYDSASRVVLAKVSETMTAYRRDF